MRIFQISGRGRVGKSTLANFIAKHSFERGYIPVILPFAQAIKKAAEAEGITKESDSSRYREFCQNLGATKRQQDPDYWVTRTYEAIQEYMLKEIENKQENKKHYEYIIIQDDVRYMNELALGRELVATQIFLDSGHRELEENNAEWRKHESELLGNSVEFATTDEYDELFDIVISNGDSLGDLETEVKLGLDSWLELGYMELEDVDDQAN